MEEEEEERRKKQEHDGGGGGKFSVEWRIIRKRQIRLILWGNKVKEGQCRNVDLIVEVWQKTEKKRKM
jgi:hypothetical protein